MYEYIVTLYYVLFDIEFVIDNTRYGKLNLYEFIYINEITK